MVFKLVVLIIASHSGGIPYISLVPNIFEYTLMEPFTPICTLCSTAKGFVIPTSVGGGKETTRVLCSLILLPSP